MTMTLKDGKFYDDGQCVPLEFGNKKQIKLLEHVEQMRDGFIPHSIYNQHDTFRGLSFHCVCGSYIERRLEPAEEEDDIIGEVLPCPGCSFKFKIHEDDEYGMFYLKLQSKK